MTLERESGKHRVCWPAALHAHAPPDGALPGGSSREFLPPRVNAYRPCCMQVDPRCAQCLEDVTNSNQHNAISAVSQVKRALAKPRTWARVRLRVCLAAHGEFRVRVRA